ncbi:MAG: hypothetical protein JXJ17_00440 [Anaerolineae bacterium]|nr:hypothetical protein [Anaerolineae bacterium]
MSRILAGLAAGLLVGFTLRLTNPGFTWRQVIVLGVGWALSAPLLSRLTLIVWEIGVGFPIGLIPLTAFLILAIRRAYPSIQWRRLWIIGGTLIACGAIPFFVISDYTTYHPSHYPIVYLIRWYPVPVYLSVTLICSAVVGWQLRKAGWGRGSPRAAPVSTPGGDPPSIIDLVFPADRANLRTALRLLYDLETPYNALSRSITEGERLIAPVWRKRIQNVVLSMFITGVISGALWLSVTGNLLGAIFGTIGIIFLAETVPPILLFIFSSPIVAGAAAMLVYRDIERRRIDMLRVTLLDPLEIAWGYLSGTTISLAAMLHLTVYVFPVLMVIGGLPVLLLLLTETVPFAGLTTLALLAEIVMLMGMNLLGMALGFYLALWRRSGSVMGIAPLVMLVLTVLLTVFLVAAITPMPEPGYFLPDLYEIDWPAALCGIVLTAVGPLLLAVELIDDSARWL